MRLSDEQIKACILHEDNIVRKYAIDYFARSLRSDASVMETVIAALEKYGFENANPSPYPLEELKQSAATVDWCIGQLQRIDIDTLEPGSPLDDYRWSIVDAIESAEIALLRQVRERIDALPRDGYEPLLHAVGERLRLAELPTDALCKELEAFCEEAAGEEDFDEVDTDQAYRIALAISERLEAAERVVKNLSGELNASQPEAIIWMAAICVRIAGEMRLEGAIDAIVGMLDLENELMADEICRALTLIGDDQVVEACKNYVIRNKFKRGDCPSAVAVLARIPTDAALAAIHALRPIAKHQEDREQLTLAAILKFSDEEVNEAHQFIRQLKRGPEFYTLEGAAAAAAECLGIDFPEKAEWLEKARVEEIEDAARFREEDEWDDDSEGDLDDSDWDDDEDWDDEEPEVYQSEPPNVYLPNLADAVDRPTSSIRNVEPKVGRNEPCPCGSGKKFKNCCLGKKAN